MIRCGLLIGSIQLDPASVLTSEEAGLLSPRAVPKRRDDFLRGRYVAKRLLCARWPGTGLLDHCVLPDDRGVPRAVGRELSLSITHTRTFAAAAIVDAPCRVGVDAERYIEDPELIADSYFTPGEQALARKDQSGRTATTIWCAKEAVTKAAGEGLRIAMLSIEVGAVGEPQEHGWRPLELRSDEPGLRGWAWDEPGCVVSVVVAGGGEAAGPPVWELRIQGD